MSWVLRRVRHTPSSVGGPLFRATTRRWQAAGGDCLAAATHAVQPDGQRIALSESSVKCEWSSP
jgi:hypothetical protein